MSKRDKGEDSFYRTMGTDKENSTHRTLNTTSSKSAIVNSKENIYRSEDFIQSYLNNKIAEITKSFDLRETVSSTIKNRSSQYFTE